MNQVKFPIFKKYANDKSFFKIQDGSTFLELKITGKTFTLHKIVAKILPERVMIHDMLSDTTGFWIPSTNEEFEKNLIFCKQNFKELA